MRPLRHVVPAVLAASALAGGLVGAGLATLAGLAGPVGSAGASTTPHATNQIATLALANVGKHACSENTLGSKAYDTSCTGNGGQPEYWCADFARWVWAKSGVQDTAWLTAAAGSFYTYGLEYGTLTATPAVGDAAVFNYAGGGSAEHVAIVTKVQANGDIETVSGDWAGDSGTEAQFASTSSVVLNDPAYPGNVGSWPGIMGMTISGFVAPVGVTVNPISGRTLLGARKTLTGTQTLTSQNGTFSLGLSTTGQLVETAAGRTVWTSGSAGAAGDQLLMRPDGDLVVESVPSSAAPTPTIYWSSGTGGHAAGGNYRLALYDDGGMAVLAADTPLWSVAPTTVDTLANNTSLTTGQALISSNGMYELYMQRDGNVVEYTAGRALWWTGTGGNSGARTTVRQNGRLVVLSPTGHVLFNSHTAGGSGTASLVLGDDGTVSVMAGATVLWSNGSAGWNSPKAPVALQPPPPQATR